MFIFCLYISSLLAIVLYIYIISKTNVKLDTAQIYICIGIGGKLKTLTTHRRVVCDMYSGL